MQINLRSWGTWTIILTFLVSGLGAITGLVPPTIGAWVTLVVTFIGGILHSNQIVGKI
jgi:hypothetical protein